MMMTLLEDVRQAVRQMLRSSDMMTTVLPLLVLGIALNVGVLKAVDAVRMEMGGQQMSSAECTMMKSPAQRMAASFRKMMAGGQRSGCMKSRVQEYRAEAARYGSEAKQVVYCALGRTSMC